MKNQDEKFILKRDRVRNHLVMTRLDLKNQTYQKVQSQQVNKKYDSPLMDWEVEDFDKGLEKVQTIIQEMRDELRS